MLHADCSTRVDCGTTTLSARCADYTPDENLVLCASPLHPKPGQMWMSVRREKLQSHLARLSPAPAPASTTDTLKGSAPDPGIPHSRDTLSPVPTLSRNSTRAKGQTIEHGERKSHHTETDCRSGRKHYATASTTWLLSVRQTANPRTTERSGHTGTRPGSPEPQLV